MNEEDYLWDNGCCLCCHKSERIENNCWCDGCRCHSCIWYEQTNEGYYENEKEEYYFDEYQKGYCKFPSSEFDFSIEYRIKAETDKAYLIEFENEGYYYEPIWFPKKAVIIMSDKDEKGNYFHWIRVKGWFLSLKMNEFENMEREEYEDLWHLFYDTIQEGWSGE